MYVEFLRTDSATILSLILEGRTILVRYVSEREMLGKVPSKVVRIPIKRNSPPNRGGP